MWLAGYFNLNRRRSVRDRRGVRTTLIFCLHTGAQPCRKLALMRGKERFGQDLGCFSHFLHSLLKLQGSTPNAQGWEMTLFPSRTSRFYHFLRIQNVHSTLTKSNQENKCAQLTQKIKLKKNNIYFMHFVQPATAMVPARPVAKKQWTVPGQCLLPGWFECLCCKLLPYNQE